MATEILNIYIPAPDSSIGMRIHPRSGIVGRPEETPLGPKVRIDYEGNVHGAMNIVTYEDKLFHAAGRHLWNNGKGYPTTARAWVDEKELIQIGTYTVDTQTWRVLPDITRRDLLEAWLA